MNIVVQNTNGKQTMWAQQARFRVNDFLQGLASIAALVIPLILGSQAQAALDIGVGTSFSGAPPNSSSTPWIDSTFQDLGPNRVRLTITAPNLSNPEYLQSLYLNFNDTKQVSSLIFTPVFSLWGRLDTDYSLDLSRNGEQAATGGSYDILLGFSGDHGASRRFGTGDVVVFDITTSQANTELSSLDFAMRSVPGSAGSFYAAAFIQGTGLGHKDSDFAGANTFTVLGVPEPAYGFAAVGFCLVGFGISVRRGLLRKAL